MNITHLKDALESAVKDMVSLDVNFKKEIELISLSTLLVDILQDYDTASLLEEPAFDSVLRRVKDSERENAFSNIGKSVDSLVAAAKLRLAA